MNVYESPENECIRGGSQSKVTRFIHEIKEIDKGIKATDKYYFSL